MNEDFQHRLIKARSGHGWSQADLAEVSGVAPAQISRYELGKSKPRTEVIARLAKSLAVAFDWLAYGNGEMDIGASVPEFPASKTATISLEVDADLKAAMDELCRDRGLTRDMLLNTLVREFVYGKEPKA